MNEITLPVAVRKIRACEGETAAQLMLEVIIAQHVAAEREACAKLCDGVGTGTEGNEFYEATAACAKGIRARKV